MNTIFFQKDIDPDQGILFKQSEYQIPISDSPYPPSLKRAGDFFGANEVLDFLQNAPPLGGHIQFLNEQFKIFLDHAHLLTATFNSPLPHTRHQALGNAKSGGKTHSMCHMMPTQPARQLIHRLLSLAVRAEPERTSQHLYSFFQKFLHVWHGILNEKTPVLDWVDARTERLFYRLSWTPELLKACHDFFALCLHHMVHMTSLGEPMFPRQNRPGQAPQRPPLLGDTPSRLPAGEHSPFALDGLILSLPCGQRTIQKPGAYVVMGLSGEGIWVGESATTHLRPAHIVHHTTREETFIKNVGASLLRVFCAIL